LRNGWRFSLFVLVRFRIVLVMTAPLPHLSDSPFIRRFLGGMPRDMADSFTPDQLQAVQRAFGMRYATDHTVDMRRRVGLLGRKFYVVLLVGRERQGDAPPPRRLLPYGLAAVAVSAALMLLT
jgi:hypothetical protein